jgi:hypothetical protein
MAKQQGRQDPPNEATTPRDAQKGGQGAIAKTQEQRQFDRKTADKPADKQSSKLKPRG